MTKKKKRTAERTANVASAPLLILFAVSPFITGLYFEWQSCAASAVLLIYLIYCAKKAGGLRIPQGSGILALAVIVCSFPVSALWATDRGMALFGFVKFLPVLLFAFALAQLETEERLKFRRLIPVCGCIMVLLSFALSKIPSLSSFFLVDGRLSGFFQYPNVFSAYLTAGLLIVMQNITRNVKSISMFIVLCLGIILSGSRGAMAVCAVAVIAQTAALKNDRERRNTALMCLGGAVALGILFALVTGKLSQLGSRYFSDPFRSSTFLGRLLYDRDAVPVILKHPLGLGYFGYYFRQGEFQTGVYSVVHIHNELFQLLLDTGWIPTGFAVWALVEAISLQHRENNGGIFVLLAVLAHSLFDFDFQFIAMGFVIVLYLNVDGRSSGRRIQFPGEAFVFAALIAVCVWLGADSALQYSGKAKEASALYGGNTMAKMMLLSEADTAPELEAIADDILRTNRYAAVAWSAKAEVAFSEGRTEDVARYKQKAISLLKYSAEEYDDYEFMLDYCRKLYDEAENAAGSEYCTEKQQELDQMRQSAMNSVSKLGWLINDRPDL